MGYIKMSDLINELNELENEVNAIAFSDNEKFEYFTEEILKLRQDLFDFDDEKHEASIGEKEFWNRLEGLKLEWKNYLKYGKNNHFEVDSPFLEDSKQQVSGIEKQKRYRINLYRTILEDLKKSSKIDLERLKKLKDKWNEEKASEYINYSAVEIDVVEDQFASLFLEYQIRNVAQNKSLIVKSSTEFCDEAKYEKQLKTKLREVIKSKENETTERMNLEQLYMNGNGTEIENSKEFWSIVTGVNVEELKIEAVMLPEQDTIIQEDKEFNVDEDIVFNVPVEIHPNQRHLHTYVEPKAICSVRISILGHIINIPMKFCIDAGEIKIPKFFEENFKIKNKITAIQIPEGVTQIGDEMNFMQFANLEYVYLPNSLQIIENRTFYHCYSLLEVRIPSGVKKIGAYAFFSCERLRTIDLSKTNISIIESNAFEMCSNLKSVFLPDELQGIETSAFSECERLSEINLPNSLKYIEENAFFDCCNIDNIIIPENIQVIQKGTFCDCKHLNKVTLPTNLQRIETYAFARCALKSIYIPNVRKIEECAFFKCYNLYEVCLGRKKKSIKIHSNAFPKQVRFTYPFEGSEDDAGENNKKEFLKIFKSMADSYEEGELQPTIDLDTGDINFEHEER